MDAPAAYELWDTEQDTLVGTYPTASAAYAAVRAAVERHGNQALTTISLGHERADGELEVIAAGHELIQLAFGRGQRPGAALAV